MFSLLKLAQRLLLVAFFQVVKRFLIFQGEQSSSTLCDMVSNKELEKIFLRGYMLHLM
jgi:hypothetical protein